MSTRSTSPWGHFHQSTIGRMKPRSRSLFLILAIVQVDFFWNVSPAYAECTAGTINWLSNTSTYSWGTAGKWTGSNIPSCAVENVVIPSVMATRRMTSIGATYTIGSLTINSGGFLVPGTESTLIVSGNFTNNGTGNITSGSTLMNITMGGTANQTFTNTESIKRLTVNNTGTAPNNVVTLASTLTLGAGGLVVTAGTASINSALNLSASGLTFNGGSITLNAALTLPSGSVLTIPQGGVFTVGSAGTLNALGGITVNGSLILQAGANLVMGSSKTLSVGSTGTLQVVGASGNLGKITVNGAPAANTYSVNVAGAFNGEYFQFSHLDASGINITGNVVKMDSGRFSYPASGGVAITLGSSATNGDTNWMGLEFNDDFAYGNVKNINATNFVGSKITLSEALGIAAGAGTSIPANSVKLSWGSSWALGLSCPAYGSSGSGSFAGSGTGATLAGASSCERTASRFTKLTYNSADVTTSGTLRSDWNVGGANYEMYAIHTGDFLVVPPIMNNEVKPIFAVNATCPIANTTVNWIFTAWDDASKSLNNFYLLGSSDITGGTGATVMTRQYTVTGTLKWTGTYALPGTACSNGTVVHNGSGDLEASSYYTASGAGVYKAASGRSTFFFPQATANLATDYGSLKFEGIQFDSSSTNGVSDTVQIIGSSDAAGLVYTIKKVTDFTKDSQTQTALATATSPFTDVITISTANSPRPGMHLGSVTRTGTGAGGPTAIACISNYSTDKGSRLICAGRSPTTPTIPYSVTLVETATKLTTPGMEVSFSSFHHYVDPTQTAMIKQADGKILLSVPYEVTTGGFQKADLGVARLNTDLTLDTSFGGNSTGMFRVARDASVTAEMNPALAVYPNATGNQGKIIVAGVKIVNTTYCIGELFVARYNANGTIDTSFGTSGYYQGGLVSGGQGTTGPVPWNTTSAICPGDYRGIHYTERLSVGIQSTDKVVVAVQGFNGTVWKTYALRLDASGVPDSSFKSGSYNGWREYIGPAAGHQLQASAMKILSNDKIILGGRNYNGSTVDLAWFQLNASDGTLDTSVEPAGDHYVIRTSTNSGDYGLMMDVAANGQVVIGSQSYPSGESAFGVARWNSNGTIDNGFGSSGLRTLRVSTVTDYTGDRPAAIAFDSNSNIVMVGQYKKASTYQDAIFMRYLASNGNLDTSMDGGGDGAIAKTLSAYDSAATQFFLESNTSLVALIRQGNASAVYKPWIMKFTIPSPP